EMQTGEGKTFAGLLPAYVLALSGRGVHVCLPNAYLAQRDQAIASPVFSRLGLSTAVRRENDSFQVTRAAYEADLTYGPGQLFGFDYLRDQWTRRQFADSPLGSATMARVLGRSMDSQLRMRGLYAAVVDEADQVLVDDATSPLLICAANDRPAPDAMLHQIARLTALSLQRNADFEIDSVAGDVQLTDHGFRHVYENEEFATHVQLNRPWHAYVISALKAEFLLLRDRHYVVIDDRICLVEQSTGRVFRDRTWSDGLHQAVQTKERLVITAETQSQGRITRQAYFRMYENLCGMTGTAQACRRELHSIYGLDVSEIKTRLPSRRRVMETKVFPSRSAKLVGLVDETTQVIREGRAVLVGTNHIEQTETIAEAFRKAGIIPAVLNGVQSGEEADIIAQAGSARAVTVATHLAGRGTDIKLASSVAKAGGLHVIGWEHHRLSRVDRQLIGRGARQGDPGTARFLISPDDHFIAGQAPHLAAAVIRCLDCPKAIPALCHSLAAVQRTLESHDRSVRYRLMRQNQRPGNALTRGIAPAENPRGEANQNRSKLNRPLRFGVIR
ncbi:MAG: hypothetical protein KDB00_23340, partial [Planctomycetales bacterium]|nr:hypothetical protein [Planctomycetales bacterium]